MESLAFTRRRDQGRRKDDLDTENCTKGHKASLKSPCNSRRRGAVIVAFSLLHRDAYLVGGFGPFQSCVPQSQATTRRQLIQRVLSSSFERDGMKAAGAFVRLPRELRDNMLAI